MMSKNLFRCFTSSCSSLNPLSKITKILNFSIETNLGAFAYFCSSPTLRQSSSDSDTKDSLFRRLVRVTNDEESIPRILEQWIDEGKEVDVNNVRTIIKHFRHYKRYSHALQIAEWIDSIEHSHLTSGDAAIHLDLISKVHGLAQADKYFESMPDDSRVVQTYGALLNCYVRAKSLDKAEATLQKMRQLGYAKTLSYNNMLNLYYQMGKQEKLKSLVQEMEDQGIYFDKFSYSIQLNACIAASDIGGMEKLLMKMEADPLVVVDWNSYSIAANGYLKAGDIDKAEQVLKKSERLITRAKAAGGVGPKAPVKAGEKAGYAYQVLMTLYARMGRKDEVYRIWNLNKKRRKFYNRSYSCIISSLIKLDDLDGAENLLDEWLAEKVHFDIKVPNMLVTAFCKKGDVEKAESIISKLKESGNEPNASTWSRMASGYFKNNQIENAVELTKRSIITSFRGWRPDLPVLASCLEYLKKKGDVDGAEEIMGLLEDRGKFSADFRERISRYLRKGNLIPAVLIR